MKNQLVLLLLIVCLAKPGMAQTYRSDKTTSNSSTSTSKSVVLKKKKKEYVYPSNVIKLNLSSLLFKAVGLQYEHKVRKNMSLALGVIYRPKSRSFYNKLLGGNDTVFTSGLSPETKAMFASSRYRSLMITPEFRYYFRKKAPKGLYLAPFFRGTFDRLSFDYSYHEDGTFNLRTASARLNSSSIGGGILFGYHLITKKKLSIDFWFLGPWYGSSTYKINSTVDTKKINEFERAIVSSNMEDIYNLAGSTAHQIEWNANGFSGKYKKGTLGLRMIGINLGYNF